mgnify:CR=1 FL=1
MLVNFVKYSDINNPSELKMNASIVKHVEQSEIYFEFSNNFILEDIPDEIIMNLRDNIENNL